MYLVYIFKGLNTGSEFTARVRIQSNIKDKGFYLGLYYGPRF